MVSPGQQAHVAGKVGALSKGNLSVGRPGGNRSASGQKSGGSKGAIVKGNSAGRPSASTTNPGKGNITKPFTPGAKPGGNKPAAKPNLYGQQANLSPSQLIKMAVIADFIAGRIENALLCNALQNLATGGILSPDERICIREFVTATDCPLSANEIALVSAGLEATEPGSIGEATAAEGTGETGVAGTKQNRRYLMVKNDTPERVTVWVQYRTMNNQDGWSWYPADPDRSAQAARYTLEPGEETYLSHGDDYLTASRVRLWGQSAGGTEWHDYKESDLWLVDEEDQDGEHYYVAEEMETYTFTLQ
jgi:hypothetical protein